MFIYVYILCMYICTIHICHMYTHIYLYTCIQIDSIRITSPNAKRKRPGAISGRWCPTKSGVNSDTRVLCTHAALSTRPKQTSSFNTCQNNRAKPSSLCTNSRCLLRLFWCGCKEYVAAISVKNIFHHCSRCLRSTVSYHLLTATRLIYRCLSNYKLLPTYNQVSKSKLRITRTYFTPSKDCSLAK